MEEQIEEFCGRGNKVLKKIRMANSDDVSGPEWISALMTDRNRSISGSDCRGFGGWAMGVEISEVIFEQDDPLEALEAVIKGIRGCFEIDMRLRNGKT